VSARHARGAREEGQASVELALLLPLVLLLLLAILQVGLLARDAVLVSHASREGARAAATDLRPGAAAAAARRSAGLDADRMEVAVSGSRVPGGRVSVTVSYRAATDVPLIGRLLGEPTMRSSTTMRVEAPLPRAVAIDLEGARGG
jgi:Flp pilus assembly protein TadG